MVQIRVSLTRRGRHSPELLQAWRDSDSDGLDAGLDRDVVRTWKLPGFWKAISKDLKRAPVKVQTLSLRANVASTSQTIAAKRRDGRLEL